jgi:hypothetical protein
MNTNSRFLKEARELEARWANDPITKRLLDGAFRAVTAKDLECQRLHNETGNWDCCDECKVKEAEKGK